MRSSDNTKWQACMRETDADRSWQAGHGEPWTSKRDEQGRDRRKAFLSWFLPFTVNLEDLQMHVLAHSSERANSESTGDASKKWRHKNGSKVFMLTSAKKKKTKEKILRAEKCGDLTTAKHTRSSTKDVNLGTITDTQSRYKFSPLDGIRVEPKLHRRRRIIFKRLQKPSHEGKTYSYKQFIRMWQALYRIIMESSINYTSSITDKQNCRTNRTSSKRRDISRIIAIWIGW